MSIRQPSSLSRPLISTITMSVSSRYVTLVWPLRPPGYVGGRRSAGSPNTSARREIAWTSTRAEAGQLGAALRVCVAVGRRAWTAGNPDRHARAVPQRGAGVTQSGVRREPAAGEPVGAGPDDALRGGHAGAPIRDGASHQPQPYLIRLNRVRPAGCGSTLAAWASTRSFRAHGL